MIMNTIGRMGSEAGGILNKVPTFVSMVRPCSMEKVWSWARQRVIMMVQQKIGTMPNMIFAFSTWVTLLSFHGF